MAKSKNEIATKGIADLVGKAVFVRAVTHYYTGRLVECIDRNAE